MPVYPLVKLPPTDEVPFAHMSKHDGNIWRKFLAAYGPTFESVAYDVALGGARLPLDAGDEPTRLGWQYSTALKVDVVGFRESEVWLIEVKPHAGVSAIGAALCYDVLAGLDKFTDLSLVPCVVTDYTSADVRVCAEELGVVLIAVGDPAPPALEE